MKLSKVTEQQYRDALDMHEGEWKRFGRALLGKTNMKPERYWGDNAIGAWSDDGELMGLAITTVGVNRNKIGNFQLLHTFTDFGGQGIGKALVKAGVSDMVANGAKYMRISSEPEAKSFYEHLGFVWQGQQKSGTFMCMCKLNGHTDPALWDNTRDEVIYKAVHSKARGSCLFGEIYDV